MDDQESKSPWDKLAQELGAEPSSDAFERNQPPAVEIPTSEQDENADYPQPAASDWNALAGSLGLEVPEPSQPEAETEPPVAEIEQLEEPEQDDEQVVSEISFESSITSDSFGAGIIFETSDQDSDIDDDSSVVQEFEEDEIEETLPPLPSEVDQIMSEGEWDSGEVTDELDDESSDDDQSDDQDEERLSAIAAKNAFDALFSAEGSALAIPSTPITPRRMSEERSLDVDLSDDNGDSEARSDDSEEEEKEQRPKRRRSRRRRGRGRGRKSEADRTNGEETSGEEGLDDQDAELNGEDRTESERDDSSEEERKPRRRRTRRRSRRAASAEGSKGEDESLDSLTYGDNELASGRGSSNRDSTGHRNMPTWAEALSGIIESNMELHSKTPAKQSSSRGRGRGGRGRGRGRGNKS